MEPSPSPIVVLGGSEQERVQLVAQLVASGLVATGHSHLTLGGAPPALIVVTGPEAAHLVAEALGHPRHTVAYQSGPGDSRIAWTGPDIVPVVQAAHAAGARDLVVQAAGFLVDHTEVLYDLDVEARGEAARLGVGFTRAACVHDHPAFIAMLADGVEAAFAMQGAGVG